MLALQYEYALELQKLIIMIAPWRPMADDLPARATIENVSRLKARVIRKTPSPGHHNDRAPPGLDEPPRATAVVERCALPRPPPTANASPGEPELCSVEALP